MSGELAKVIIRGYELPEENAQQGNVVGEFQAMFNPESFGVTNSFSFDDKQSDGETGSDLKFQSVTPREFSFEFVIDTTGASGIEKDIETEVENFKNATGFKEVAGFVGQQRRTFYLTITWGTFNIRCVLKSMDIQYTLFRPDGTPIRAMISATFAEYKTPQQQARENPESVLNLTQVRNVLDQDNLTNMAKNLYGDGKKYIDLAKANGVNNLKELLSGSRLNFPPVDQLASSLQDSISPFVDRGQQIIQGAKDLAEGKGQIVQSVSELANSARRQAQTAIAQAELLAGQVQSQVEGQVGGLIRQGQNLAGQVQSQVQGQLGALLQQGQGLAGQFQGQAAGLLQQGQGLAGQFQGQAAGLLQQGQGLAGQLQGQAQGQLQSLLQQGQNIGGQLQSQAGQLVQGATQFAQGAGSGLLQNAEQLAGGLGQGLLDNLGQLGQGAGGDLLQGGRDALSEGFDDITNFFDF